MTHYMIQTRDSAMSEWRAVRYQATYETRQGAEVAVRMIFTGIETRIESYQSPKR